MGSPGSLEITNSIFSGNTATGCGGGIDSGGGDSNLTLTNVTFSGNYAGTHGGALCAFINAKIVNSILWGDGAAQEAPETGDSSYTATFSDIQGGAAGAGNINVDPLFGSPVTASSTPTIAGDYHLQLTSPAIDAGNNDPVTAATDLGGYPRKMDVGTVVDTGHGTAPIVDLGAYETPGLPVANAGPDQHAATNVLITLDGSGSSDPVGRIPLTYLWVQTGGLDTPVTLLHSTDVKPTFTTPVVQSVKQITLTLVVTNKLGQASLPSSVRITIQPPLFIPLVRKN
jgi:predicted outer membrane repeat protein